MDSNNLQINSLSRIFGSRAKAQEIILLIEELKPVVRQGFYADELPLIVDFCNANRINIVRSEFLVRTDDADKGFSNKGLLISDSSDHGMFFLYLSKDRVLAEHAAHHEKHNDHRSLGLLLGYPECCIMFFIENFSAENADLVKPSDNAYTNLSLRDKDYVLLSHFPCSPRCSGSLLLAEKYLEAIKKHDPEYANELLMMLTKQSSSC